MLMDGKLMDVPNYTRVLVVRLDFSKANKQQITLTTNTTFTFNTAPGGPCSIHLIIKQPAGANYTVTFPATAKWPGGTAYVATATNGAEDILNIIYNGTDYYVADVKNWGTA